MVAAGASTWSPAPAITFRDEVQPSARKPFPAVRLAGRRVPSAAALQLASTPNLPASPTEFQGLLLPSVPLLVADLARTSHPLSAYANISTMGGLGNSERLALAHEYNRLLSTGAITVGGESRTPTTDAAVEGALDYAEMLKLPGGAMGRLKIPSIDVDLPIYHGTSDETLGKGVGHLEGTSLPVGGIDTHAVLSAHRGLASATMFDNLDKLDTGDTFVVEVAGEVLTYRVFETQVVDPGDTQTVLPRAGLDIVTLVTCTPLGINTHRILVTGERITPTPIKDIEAAGAVPDIPGFPWWALILPVSMLVVGLYVWRSGYPSAE